MDPLCSFLTPGATRAVREQTRKVGNTATPRGENSLLSIAPKWGPPTLQSMIDGVFKSIIAHYLIVREVTARCGRENDGLPREIHF